jgi:hypothetical protein
VTLFLLAADTSECSILVLLDHNVLGERLDRWVGIYDVALDRFRSYLCGRHFSVSMGGSIPTPATIQYGIPQGSILTPPL